MSTEQDKSQDVSNPTMADPTRAPGVLVSGPRPQAYSIDQSSVLVSTREAYAAFMAPLYAALAKAQAAFETIERDRTVWVQPKKREDGSWPDKYSFDYATLSSVHASTRKALNENGLAVTGELSSQDGSWWTLKVDLVHSSGASKSSACKIPFGRGWQELGSAVSYARRYIEQTLLGVIGEFEDDANEADGNELLGNQRRDSRQQPDRNQRQQPRPPANQQRPPQQERKPEPARETKPTQTETKPAPAETKPAPAETKPVEPAKRPSNTPPPLPTDEEKAAMASLEAKCKERNEPVPEFAELLNLARIALVKAKISARLKETVPGLTKQILGERCRKATGKEPKDLTLEDTKAWLDAELKATA